MSSIKMLDWYENLQKMNDRQLQQFAKQQQLDFTLEEIKKLRKILQGASISWAITGVPKEVLKQIKSVVGGERYKKMKKVLDL